MKRGLKKGGGDRGAEGAKKSQGGPREASGCAKRKSARPLRRQKQPEQTEDSGNPLERRSNTQPTHSPLRTGSNSWPTPPAQVDAVPPHDTLHVLFVESVAGADEYLTKVGETWP